MSFNKISIIGNLGRDPELRYTPQGVAVCTFTIATNEKRTSGSGEKVEIVTWFKVTCWRQQAENVAKYCHKGQQIYVEGRLRLDTWQDKEGANRFTLDVQATETQFLSNPRTEGGQEEPEQQQHKSQSNEMPTHTGSVSKVMQPENDDDIPF